jgi:hypothetical protein
MSNERTCLTLILGTSRFPHLEIDDNPAFAASARGFADCVAAQRDGEVAFRVESGLFDSAANVIEQRAEMDRLFTAHADATDLLVYYVGHGGFLRKRQEYYLVLRDTREGTQDVTGLRSSSLAEAVAHRFDRTYILLDACFAGEVLRDFQDVDVSAAVARRTLSSLPARGVALLLASSKDRVAVSPTGLERTMFSDSLLDVLAEGIPGAGRFLTLADVADQVRTSVVRRFGDEAVLPEVHSPQQAHGDAAQAPLFVNPAYDGREATRLEVLERRLLELEARVSKAAVDVTLRTSRSPGSSVTWTCEVVNTGEVRLRDVELSDEGVPIPHDRFDLDPAAVRRVEFVRDSDDRRTVTVTARSDAGHVVSAHASARVPKPAPAGVAPALALPAFRRALRQVKGTATALDDAEVNRLLGLIVEGERHFRVAKGLSPPASGWGARVIDWDRESKAVASRDDVVMVKLRPLEPDEIAGTIALLADRVAEATGVRIPTYEFA